MNARASGCVVQRPSGDVADCYDRLAALYHLVYEDWEGSVEAQGAALDALIRGFRGAPGDRVLDVACGIGTQALGLARRGYALTASDVSTGAVARARREAAARGLSIDFSVADMRLAHDHHGSGFDGVLCADNALAHLLAEDEVVATLRQFHDCLRPGGLCILSVRDHAGAEGRGTQVKLHGVRYRGSTRYVVFQVWEWRGHGYDMTLYVVQDAPGAACRTQAFRARSLAMTADGVLAWMARAGFRQVERRDDVLFQPVIVGVRPAVPEAA